MKFTNRQSVAVVWGWRRVGKTRLLLKWIERHKGVYYVANRSVAACSREVLSDCSKQGTS